MNAPDKKEPILFIAHHFPPLGGPGVTRAIHFARELSAMGYELHVLTVTIEDIEQGSYPPDYSLLEDLPDDIHIHRISIRYPKKFRDTMIRFKLFRLFWFFLYPLFWEPSARWPYRCFKPAQKLIREHNIRLIWNTSGPFVSSQLAWKLKRRCGVKWICDLRDPYTDTYSFSWPSRLHWLLCRWMERRVFRRADRLVVVTPGMKRLYLKRHLVDPDKLVVITNGYS
jgi:glycosyltransferase involved in cell wall biosynthesis